MSRASIVYWYPADKMRMDGGGLRIRAWEQALTELGYDVQVSGLWTIGGGVARGSLLSSVKRALIPMPFMRDLPKECLDADLVVATVPATFGSALKDVAADRLVLDWMDLWSTASMNMGASHWVSRPGGRIQSRLWQRREQEWTARARRNAYAGYGDLLTMRPVATGRSAWIPTPVEYHGITRTSGTRRLGFIGNLDYPPNEKSLRKFLDEYLGSVRDQGWELVVAGFGSEKVAGWGHPVTVLGEVADSEAFYREIDAAIVPIEHGGGIKVKAIEALSYGVPLFTTDHVRDGFSEEFRPYLPDLDAIRGGGLDTVFSNPVPRDVFEARFATSSFTRDVKSLIEPE